MAAVTENKGMIELQKLLKADAAQNISDLPLAGRCKTQYFRGIKNTCRYAAMTGK